MDPVDDAHAVTPAWLTGALQAGGHELVVASVATEVIGAGQMGATHRLHLTYRGTPGPPTLVAKLAAGDADSRRRVASGYRNEVGFYTQLVESLDVATPRCWFGAITDDALTFTLVLDDLAPLRPGSQADGCTIAQADDAVRNLARLHASRWNDDSLFDLDFLPRLTEWGASRLGGILASATDEFVERYGHTGLDDADAATLHAVADVITPWQLARPAPFGVLHGDYRLDNLMMPLRGQDGVVALDWQGVIVGLPARDLSYFVCTSLDVDARREAERDLVASYHRELVAHGVDDYELERGFDDYRFGLLQVPLTMVVGCIYATGERSEESDRMFVTMTQRGCTAIRDLDSIALVGD
ncbi:MAG: phosphotransferase [Acidimicrobiia bacterium]